MNERPGAHFDAADNNARQAPKGVQSGEHPPASQATVIVRGETVHDERPTQPAEEGESRDAEVSEDKVKMESRLPALYDDGDVGVQKRHIVVRDGKADLSFTGSLLASAAARTGTGGHWEEYRIYDTNAGKHVFSKVTRSVFLKDQDRHAAEVFDPSPTSLSSQLLRGARELTHSRPLEWTDAAVAFFGYNPLAKTLYRKLGDQFDEHVN
jgi:hypothetical protein